MLGQASCDAAAARRDVFKTLRFVESGLANARGPIRRTFEMSFNRIGEKPWQQADPARRLCDPPSMTTGAVHFCNAQKRLEFAEIMSKGRTVAEGVQPRRKAVAQVRFWYDQRWFLTGMETLGLAGNLSRSHSVADSKALILVS